MKSAPYMDKTIVVPKQHLYKIQKMVINETRNKNICGFECNKVFWSMPVFFFFRIKFCYCGALKKNLFNEIIGKMDWWSYKSESIVGLRIYVIQNFGCWAYMKLIYEIKTRFTAMTTS